MNLEGGNVLGVGCSDPYDNGLNGVQDSLGPRSEINPATAAQMMRGREVNWGAMPLSGVFPTTDGAGGHDLQMIKRITHTQRTA